MDKENTAPATRRLAGVILAAGGFGSYPIVASPGILPERVKLLREAYNRTLKDPEFLDEAKKNRWELKPVAAAELEALIVRSYRSITGCDRAYETTIGRIARAAELCCARK